MPREKRALQKSECAAALLAQAESFATALVLIALALDTLPREQAGAIAANANEITLRLGQLRTLLLTK